MLIAGHTRASSGLEAVNKRNSLFDGFSSGLFSESLDRKRISSNAGNLHPKTCSLGIRPIIIEMLRYL